MTCNKTLYYYSMFTHYEGRTVKHTKKERNDKQTGSNTRLLKITKKKLRITIKNYSTDNLKYSKISDCLSLVGRAKPCHKILSHQSV